MNRNSIYAFLLLTTSCGFKDDKTPPGSIDGHFLEATRIIQNNSAFFQNANDKMPRVFFTSSLSVPENQSKLKEKDYLKLLSLVKRHGITIIYISSLQEIWYVVKEEKGFLKTKEYLIGFTDSGGIEKAKINYYKIKNLEKLNENWFSLVVEQSLID